MTDYDSVFSAAAQLSVADRLRLIDEIASTVPDDESPSLSAEWLAEVERRATEIDSGAVATMSWEDVHQRLQKKVGLDGAN